MAMQPSIDPERLYELRLLRLSPEAREMLDALGTCANLAEKVVLITGTKYGLNGVAEYLRNCKHDRREMKQAAANLKASGLEPEGMLCEVAAPSKPSPPPSWKQRQAKRMRDRARQLKLRP
jgi:hypothetical protein